MTFLEPAGTWSRCGRWRYPVAQLVVEALFLVVYVFGFALMQLAYGAKTFFSLKKQGPRGRKLYPVMVACILALMLVDLVMRTVIYAMTQDPGHPVYALSRPFRAFLLVSNTRPLRDLFATISRVIPNVLLLVFGCFVMILIYSIIGFHLFRDIYPPEAHPQTFQSWYTASISLFVLFSTENYPDVMWPAYEISKVFSIFFLSFLLLGGGMFVVVLGVVYDTYRQSVVDQAFKNFKKERVALSAAYALIARCPHGIHTCNHFPCEHGDGILDLHSWTQLFMSFDDHPSNSYVAKVYMRNAKDLTPRQAVRIAVSLFETVSKKPEEKSAPAKDEAPKKGPKARKSRQRSVTPGTLQVSMNARMNMQKLDIIGFYQLCDRIRSRLEVAADQPLLKAKHNWLRILQVFSKDQKLQQLEKWQRRRSSVEKDIKQLRDARSTRKIDNRSEWDVAVVGFNAEMNKLSPLDRTKIRTIMNENILYLEELFGDSVDTGKIRALVKSHFIEQWATSSAWTFLMFVVVFCHLIVQLQLETNLVRSHRELPRVYMLLDVTFVGVYVLDTLLQIWIWGSAYFKRFWNRYNFTLTAIAVVSHVLLSIPAARDLFTERILRALSSVVIFRVLHVAVTVLEASRQGAGHTYDRYVALKNLLFNVSRVCAFMILVLLVVFYTFAVVGMEVFGCSRMEYSGSYDDPYHYTHFNNMASSFLVLFQVTTTSNWHELMYGAVRSTSLLAVLYFAAFYFLVIMVILNLMAALVVEALVNVSNRQETAASKHLKGQNTFNLYTRFLS